MNRHIRQVSSKLSKIEEQYITGSTALGFMKGFLNMSLFELTQIHLDWLYTLNYYFMVLEGGITAKIKATYDEEYPKGFPKSSDDSVSKMYNAVISKATEIYDSKKPIFDEKVSKEIFQENLNDAFLPYIECIKKESKKKLDEAKRNKHQNITVAEEASESDLARLNSRILATPTSFEEPQFTSNTPVSTTSHQSGPLASLKENITKTPSGQPMLATPTSFEEPQFTSNTPGIWQGWNDMYNLGLYWLELFWKPRSLYGKL
jgi:hypothetical protein